MSSSPKGLGPTWHRSSGGRGFQPPPPAERQRSRSGSHGSTGSDSSSGPVKTVNKFSILDDDEEGPPAASSKQRSVVNRSSSFGRSPTGKPGRSLADLMGEGGVAASSSSRSTGQQQGRFSSLKQQHSEEEKVTRYTREKLLALRPRSADTGVPESLKHVEGVVILSKECLDPVCWDNFDADEIWAQVARERNTRGISGGGKERGLRPSTGMPEGNLAPEPRKTSTGGGKWQRGVALPPPDENSKHRGRSDNPNDLWDDPLAATDAAADFSAFGSIPDDPKQKNDATFDFDKMTEATAKFEKELRGSGASDSGDDRQDGGIKENPVDRSRPLAGDGTTIQSGSGDDVNVFEDFDEPGKGGANEPPPAIKGAGEKEDASSRLMGMIGVNKDDSAAADKKEEGLAASNNPWAQGDLSGPSPEAQAAAGLGGISSNPWGNPVAGSSTGVDLQGRSQEAEMQRRRQEEETQRRAMAQKQAEDQARQQAMQQQQQQQGGHSQVEVILIERISSFLENSWGRSDLMSILSTLHQEDSRVIPLLGNVDSLRALIARHPQRVALRQDPAFGSEMAVLLMTNAQWQQRSEADARGRQEEMQRADQQRQMAMQNQAKPMDPNAPWFYSDPQGNVQGPFRGEEMRQWLEAGYFKGDLPISQQMSGPFRPLSNLFPDLSVAFAAPKAEEAPKPAEENGGGRARTESQASDRQGQTEAQSRELAAAQTKSEPSDQSAQLKMMLGVGSSAPAPAADEAPELTEETPAPAPKKSSKNKSAKQQKAAAAPVPAPAAASSAPAWGGGTSKKGGTRKSMSEIQQEEARASALLAMERKASGRSNSSGWANVASGGGWESGAVKQTAPAVVSGTAPNLMTQSRGAAKPNPNSSSAAASHRQTSVNAAAKKQQSSQKSKAADEFGTSMSPQLENWCKDQMRKLNGTDDLTLVAFCMTLNDPDEIRQYLTAYLGSTPQVNNFATEFIKRKGGSGGNQDEWESTVKPKKGRKKK